MEFSRNDFFKKCKSDHDRLVKLIMDADGVSVSDGIVGTVKSGKGSYPVRLYRIGDKEYRVSEKLHEYLVENGAILKEGGENGDR